MSAASETAHAEAGSNNLSPQFHTAHHFENADLQFSANKMGIWLFLVQEILFFGGLFCAFALFRAKYFAAFVEGHNHLDWKMGGVNTIVLITSSFTMALGVRAAQTNKRAMGTAMLAITFLLAGAFLVVKYFEYSHKIHDGLLPGAYFTAKGFVNPEANIFFGCYFMMTGIHGLHVIIGMGLILWILIRNHQGYYSSRYYAPVEGVGLYWHLVDLVWIYLFPLLYLVG